MNKILDNLIKEKKNFIFIGEAGSGKSEIAINLAIKLAAKTDKEVHFFDMDQTKPIFRSRDVRNKIQEGGVFFHCEEQFYDAPTLVGGVREQLKKKDNFVIMDVGGNHTGARLIGGFAPFLNQSTTKTYFVINPFRPWSKDVVAIDSTLSAILKVSHIREIGVISNPNLGKETRLEEIIEGHEKVQSMVGQYVSIELLSGMEEYEKDLSKSVDIPVFSLKTYLSNLWGS